MPQDAAGGYNVGAELIGVYINLMLYGVELVTAYSYFSGERAKRDKKFVTFAVINNLIVDTLASFALCANIFMVLLIDWGKATQHFPVNWPIPIWIFTTAIAEIVVEAFLIHRYYRLSENRIIPCGIVLLMALSLSGSLYLGIVLSLAVPKIKPDKLDYRRAVTVNLVSTFVTDICITSALTWKLLYRQRALSLHTKHLVRRIAAFAIMTGTVCSAVSLATLIPFVISPIGGISPCFGFFIGRVYTLTMLFTLLVRERLAGKALDMYIDCECEIAMTNIPISSQQTPTPNPSNTLSSRSIDTGMAFASPPEESPKSSIHHTERAHERKNARNIEAAPQN